MNNKANDSKIEFSELLKKSGCSNKVIEELYKWYDFSEHKGVASF
jgi:hypothetical protein